MRLSDRLKDRLACPDCGGKLAISGDTIACSGCGTGYAVSDSGALDLHLRRPKALELEFIVDSSATPETQIELAPLAMHPRPEVDFSGIRIPPHLHRELLSHFPAARTDSSLMLDLGCGAAGHRAVCEQAGFEYVGLDYRSEQADILADAHALPFLPESFEFVLSIAVLEHLRNPFVAMREAYQVLTPGGKLVGTVAFQEPFHGNSYYHHSHLGTYNSLNSAGFKVEALAPTRGWSGLRAQARMGLFPGMPRRLAYALVAPLELLHRAWWALARFARPDIDEQRRLRKLSGSFSFIATKPA